MITGVEVKKLSVFADSRGKVMELLRRDDPLFEKFGQAYMSTINPDTVKAWHKHHKTADYLTCVKGEVRLVLYDCRENSRTKGEIQEFIIGPENYILVKIPAEVYHGLENTGKEEAITISISTEPYDKCRPDEERAGAFSLPYRWKASKGG